MIDADVTVLVASCSAYSDCWKPFVALFDRFWPDCPYRKVLFSNGDHTETLGGFEMVGVGVDRQWCGNLTAVLRTFVTSHIVLLLLEDFWISAPVQQKTIARCVDWLECDSRFGCLRLTPIPGPDPGDELNDNLGALRHSSSYFVSCQAALWRTAHLSNVVKIASPGRSAAAFEILGSRASSELRAFHAGWRREVIPWPIEYICSAVSRGKWNPDALALAEREGVKVRSRRPIDGVS